ncbi:putative colanic acid biosynthesis acetyltransferase [Shewanella litoralis]|uniref:Colanic acid biosynthesis acetyltransferase n=1 Tax=Shewanella litoralis TaxID=2282700 RepID=A0ABQ2RAW7_9GAMM|nr:putative colanic acid biosynthesis acetyltransferase [Shewanella litoralis]GGQ16683.1 hypothetical protein GCM10009411_16200 [Shewanella litoralis]
MLKKQSLTDPIFNFSNKLFRSVWTIAYFIFFRFSPVFLFKWRCFILKVFGAKISLDSRVYPTAKIWLPSNLIVGAYSTIGPNVNVYNQGKIVIGEQVIISQGTHLCASTHDYNDPLHPLLLCPITVEDNVWVCADAFIGPNVYLSDGCVVGARAVVMKNTKPWSVYSGNPAVKIKDRVWGDK